MTDARFTPWARRSALPLDGAARAGGRVRVDLALHGAVRDLASGVTTAVPATVPVELLGPGDVTGLSPTAVRRVSPTPGTRDADGEHCAFVEFASADLPWRYSPEPPRGPRWRPWLALLVGAEDVELGRTPDGRAWASPTVTRDLDPERAACWAHVHHETVDGVARLVGSRLLCPRGLPPLADCLAVVVPLFTADGTPRWRGGRAAVELPVLHAWRFRTNDDGTFEDLAVRLHGVAPPDGLGTATVRADPGGLGARVAVAHGALAPRATTTSPPWDDPAVRDRVDVLLGVEARAEEAPTWGPPSPGRTWHDDPAHTTAWGADVGLDPRHRAAAGLGARAGVDWQERILRAAAARTGQAHLAASLLRDLATGVALSRRLASRRPAAPARVVAFHGASLGRVRHARGGTALDHLGGGTSPIGAALVSAAAARLLRPGGSVARASSDPRGVGDPGRVLTAANRCPPGPPPPLGAPDEPVDEPVSPGLATELLLGHDRAVDPEALATLLRDDEWRRIVGTSRDDPRGGERGERALEPACAPIDLDRAARDLAQLFDPSGAAVERVLGRITPRPARHDVPLEVAPDLDLPAWTWLRDHEPGWLLPGAARIPADAVVAVRSNPQFVAAFLLGLSEQAAAELRWRGVPLSAGSMPLRTFWQGLRDDDDTRPRVDLRPATEWADDSPLGDPGHAAPGGIASHLVVVLRSELLRRYPSTVVYLAPAIRIAGRQAQVDLSSPRRPLMVGRIEEDLWFLGFAVAPTGVRDWFVVLEEPLLGPRFAAATIAGVAADAYSVRQRRVRPGPDGTSVLVDTRQAVTDGGAHAAAAFSPPVRVLLDGATLLGGP